MPLGNRHVFPITSHIENISTYSDLEKARPGGSNRLLVSIAHRTLGIMQGPILGTMTEISCGCYDTRVVPAVRVFDPELPEH